LVLQKPKFGVGKKRFEDGHWTTQKKMKISKYQYAREERGLIFGAWFMGMSWNSFIKA
jgi:hypothetical protein